MLNIKFPNAEHINYVCQNIVNQKIYKVIQDNYLENVKIIEINQILKDIAHLKINNYNKIEKLTFIKTLIKDAQSRASRILDGKIPESLCSSKFKHQIFKIIFNESFQSTEKQILKTINFIFIQELKKYNLSSIEEYLAVLQYFISAGSNLAIDKKQIKKSLKSSLDKFLKNQNLPFFKINSTIVGQAGKEIIRIMHKDNSLSDKKIIDHLIQK